MKIYHTEKQEDYDALMVELEGKGFKWEGGSEMLQFNIWNSSENLTSIRVYGSEVNHASLNYYKEKYPHIPIVKYKAKADEKMKFNKQNIEREFDKFMQGGNDSFADLKERIINLVDEPEKVVVPKFVADWIKWNKGNEVSLQIMLKCYKGFYESTDARETEGEKAVQWYVDNSYKFIQAYEDGYTIEPEQLYYIPLPNLETPDGTKQVLSKHKGYKHYFANYPTESLQQWFTKEELEKVPEIYKPYATPVEENGE